ncbi:agmatinase 1 [Physcia stellaris]|nr:agmatinase 1 [Physcia stellaris]
MQVMLAVLLLALHHVGAADVFPPGPLAMESVQKLLAQDDDIDITTGSAFSGLTTFARLPYSNCFVDDGVAEYDIAILGAPFDTGVTARPGARFGPQGIRQGSRRENVFHDWARIIDCGDAPLTFLDNTVALKQLEKAHKVIAARKPRDTSRSAKPRIVTLGGDHTTTLAALRSAGPLWGKVSVIHFDSHIDTWDPSVLVPKVMLNARLIYPKPAVSTMVRLPIFSILSGAKLKQRAGTFLHLAHEEGLIRNSSIHAGIRAPLIRRKGDMRNDIRCGFETVTARDIDRIGVSGVIERIQDRVGDSKVYVSVDIDVLDPAFAPGTGTAEVGGWSTRELLSILDGLAGLHVVGADVVEVAPIYDNAGETTVLAAADVNLWIAMSETHHEPEPKNFAPKDPPKLDPPRDDPIGLEELAKCDGTNSDKPTYVAIKGTVFNVSGKDAYAPKGAYHVFAGKDASRALAQSSLKPEDCRPEYDDLSDKEKTVLDEWFTFFSKRYNIIGKVVQN